MNRAERRNQDKRFNENKRVYEFEVGDQMLVKEKAIQNR